MAARLEALAGMYRRKQQEVLAGEAEAFRDRLLEEMGQYHITKRRLPQNNDSFGAIGEVLVRGGKEAFGRVLLNFQRRIDNDFPEGNGPRLVKKGQQKDEYTFEGKSIRLGITEYKLLAFFSFHSNRVFSVDQLLNRALYGFDRNALDVNLWRLRQIIEEDPIHPTRLVTVGLIKLGAHGYMFKRPSRNDTR